jgi:hypothetical protein
VQRNPFSEADGHTLDQKTKELKIFKDPLQEPATVPYSESDKSNSHNIFI